MWFDMRRAPPRPTHKQILRTKANSGCWAAAIKNNRTRRASSSDGGSMKPHQQSLRAATPQVRARTSSSAPASCLRAICPCFRPSSSHTHRLQKERMLVVGVTVAASRAIQEPGSRRAPWATGAEAAPLLVQILDAGAYGMEAAETAASLAGRGMLLTFLALARSSGGIALAEREFAVGVGTSYCGTRLGAGAGADVERIAAAMPLQKASWFMVSTSIPKRFDDLAQQPPALECCPRRRTCRIEPLLGEQSPCWLRGGVRRCSSGKWWGCCKLR
eukprot:CAMPEP_0206554048 /NCGR_PEP_ID=MMETSP0325_2-20121206/16967_1 /ASSEMBLY_ACC=CAM_ASM_000347 /TAXON_ID=2866 /ORGANISM="Crypthecodinium cohnii, Strain Seligo" /LENGTH=273 /DNA_ID=CAMNT_0054054085 /DNA_START=414 /DNA_END=1238 /DNA_ORIENTATION=+